MNINADETDSFKELFTLFAKEHDITVGRYCAVKLLSFYNHNFDPVMLFELDADVVAPLVLKPFKHFKVKKLITKLTDFLCEVAEDHLVGYIKENYFDQFFFHNIQSIALKEGYTSVHDVAYYQVELYKNRTNIDTDDSVRFIVNFHTEPVEPKFYRDSKMKGSIKYLNVDVYYKDIESLREPMLAYYASEISYFLNIPINEVDDNVLKLIEMVKI